MCTAEGWLIDGGPDGFRVWLEVMETCHYSVPSEAASGIADVLLGLG